MSTNSYTFAKGNILVDVPGPVARLTVNNPARMNAMSQEMWQGLSDAVAMLAENDAVRVLVIAGAGERAFVSGADISEFDDLHSSAEGVAAYNAVFEAADRALYHFPMPTIAELKGFCVGGGMALAVSCDFRIAADDTRLSIPAAKLGLGYGYDGIAKLVALVGPEGAAKILFSADLFDASEALAMRLVTKAVPREELSQSVDAMAAKLCARAPKTQVACKAAIRSLTAPDGGMAREAVDQLVEACFASEDYAEGRAAFAEKRAPMFKNR